MPTDRTTKEPPQTASEPPAAAHPAAGQDLPLPHERDVSSGQVAEAPDPMIQQAKKDLDAGQVDTDMWGTPGLDDARKERLVPNTKPKP